MALLTVNFCEEEKGALKSTEWSSPQSLYRAAMGHVSMSIREGYFLEAITLCESMLSDRLEALFDAFEPGHEKAGQFQPLGPNIKAFVKLAKGDSEAVELAARLDAWREARNQALHEMVKLKEGENDDWPKRRRKVASVAREGKALVVKVSGFVRRRKKHLKDKQSSTGQSA